MIEGAVFSRPLPLTSIPSGGVERSFEASAAELAAIAARYGFLEVKALAAELAVTPEGGSVIAVTGRVRAELVQACVVTLEPVPEAIDENIVARYVPANSKGATGVAIADPSGDPDAPEPPEILVGATLDLGAIVLEHFLLAVDPYPRAPGAELPAEPADSAAESDSPFAALARLRDKGATGG